MLRASTEMTVDLDQIPEPSDAMNVAAASAEPIEGDCVMCELFAFCGEHPALLHFALQEFASHSDDTRNAEGWGIAHYVDGDVRLVKEAAVARNSACLQFIEQHPVNTTLLLSHIRRATQGAMAVRNCQPFMRELGGAMHVFAHNGHLDRAALEQLAATAEFSPVGETDSELAFCVLLAGLRPLWRNGTRPPAIDQRRQVVAAFARQMRELGPANFIYADGDALFAHAHKPFQSDGGVRPPGLWMLCRSCAQDLDAAGLQIATPLAQGSQLLVASVPLSNDPWRPVEEGELLVAQCGAGKLSSELAGVA